MKMANKERILLSSAYLGPVEYFSSFLTGRNVSIEQFDHYTKQTYRNRCVILSANGPLPLVIPVVKNHGRKTYMKDTRIDYATNWQRLHLHGITSAYNSSAFFEFYFDSFERFFRKKTSFLLDLNIALTRIVLEELDLPVDVSLTSGYDSETEAVTDMRDRIHPKKSLDTSAVFKPVPYTQVFSERFGFVPNLSIIDLLFNAGPEAKSILKAGLKRF